MMAVGAEGVVSVVSNLFPSLVREMVDDALAGEYGAAREIHFRLLPIVRAAFVESNPSPIKAMLSLRGADRKRTPGASRPGRREESRRHPAGAGGFRDRVGREGPMKAANDALAIDVLVHGGTGRMGRAVIAAGGQDRGGSSRRVSSIRGEVRTGTAGRCACF